MPFLFERGRGSNAHRLRNTGAETVHGVTIVLHGPGLLRVSTPAALEPGHAIEVRLAARDLTHSRIIVVRWFRHDGLEYVWLVSV